MLRIGSAPSPWSNEGIKLTLPSPSENQFVKFISYFRGPILYVMELAVLLAGGLQDWIDFGVIIGGFALAPVKIDADAT